MDDGSQGDIFFGKGITKTRAEDIFVSPSCSSEPRFSENLNNPIAALDPYRDAAAVTSLMTSIESNVLGI